MICVGAAVSTDHSLLLCCRATQIFLRNDPARTGKVSDEKLAGLIKGMRAAGLTKKTEKACRLGTDTLFFSPEVLPKISISRQPTFSCDWSVLLKTHGVIL